ncbi:GntR family transcriptional regulator [Arthrobacter crystallopoietes BAB-32]|uniref:GntR family transcriptional regulator n=1 Tax=Arthrobacter crystallopoietes BAB-32 TaxID=1246476 RepID=N1UX24_9MICC|nr:FadR/GntR family transcriptional regulator [Arthrobacter crystallopoietes]EMY32284.1 GntR family transcriptional regulator [Arthrobacter crystallopoietes BAB-32]
MKQNLTTALVDDLRRRIIDGAIAPGEKLPSENTLIAEHGVSRTVVREAITRLQAEGLVHTRRGAGSFALTPPAVDAQPQHPVGQVRTLEERRHLMEYRVGIETEAAALAARRHTDSQMAMLRSALDAFTRSEGNPAAALRHDFDFHRTVAEASGNPYLANAIGSLGPVMIAMPRHRLDTSGTKAEAVRLAQVSAEHDAVLAAIEAGDAQAAAAAMRTHLINSKRRLEQESGGR